MSMMPRDVVSAPLWYALAVETRWERYVRRRLEDWDREVYLPEEETRKRRRGKLHRGLVPLFPGYLFVRLVLAHGSLTQIRKVDHVIDVLRMAGDPVAIPDAAIEAVRALADVDGLIRPKMILGSAYRSGDRVRVIDGAWGGLIGEVLTVRGPERVRLLIGSLRTSIETRLVVPA